MVEIKDMIDTIIKNGCVAIFQESVNVTANAYSHNEDAHTWEEALRKCYVHFIRHLRNVLQSDVEQCTPEQQTLFKRMYAFPCGYCYNSEQPDMSMSIEKICQVLPEEKISWALQQVKNTRKI